MNWYNFLEVWCWGLGIFSFPAWVIALAIADIKDNKKYLWVPVVTSLLSLILGSILAGLK